MYTLFKEVFERHVPFDKKDFDSITERFELKTVARKKLLVKEGTVCKHFFFINKGMIRSFVDHDGDDVTTWVALPGTIETAAQSFVKKKPSAINLEALADCELLSMKREDYYFLLTHNKSFNAFAIGLLENFYLRVEDKFYSYLFLSAEERFKKMQAQFPDHFDQVPLKYLASILRIKPETLSRLRSRTKK
jgi:CRP-like cAMP-binding protein